MLPTSEPVLLSIMTMFQNGPHRQGPLRPQNPRALDCSGPFRREFLREGKGGECKVLENWVRASGRYARDGESSRDLLTCALIFHAAATRCSFRSLRERSPTSDRNGVQSQTPQSG